MGGIAGMVHFKKNFIAYKSYNTLLVRDMADSLKNRGTNTGEWVGEHAALACRIGPDQNKQPLSQTVGGYEFVLVLDGVLYETEGIRRELQRFGYRFETGDDAELLLYAYIHYGSECARLIDGVYAFCVWDSMRQRIFACRDRVGAKPFYYLYQDRSFLFASAIHALFRHPSVRPKLDKDGLCTVLSSGTHWPQGGVFAGVQELLPGHSLILDRTGLHIRPYWELPNWNHTESPAETAEHLSMLLTECVGQDMAGDMPAVILTGRPESNLLAALAARTTQERLLTCSFSVKHTNRYAKLPASQTRSDRLYVERMIEEVDSCHQYCTTAAGDLVPHFDAVTACLDVPGMAFDDGAMLCFFRDIAKEKILCATGAALFGPPVEQMVRPDTGFSALLRPVVAETLHLADFVPPASRYPIPALTPLLSRLDRLQGRTDVRVPFARYKLLEYVYNIPPEIRNAVFAQIFQTVLPIDVAGHTNTGRLAIPGVYYIDALKNSVLDVLADSRSPALAFFDANAVHAAVTTLQADSLPTDDLSLAERLSFFLQMNSWLKLYNPALI